MRVNINDTFSAKKQTTGSCIEVLERRPAHTVGVYVIKTLAPSHTNHLVAGI